MPMSTDIHLPRELEPSFPACCCRCLAPDADHTARFSAMRFSWWQVVLVWSWWSRKRIRHEVPCCGACRAAIRRRKWLEVIVFTSLVAASLVIMMPWLKSIGANRQWQKLGVFGGALVCWIPFLAWCVLRPPAFDMTAGDDHVTYEFANADYARMFAARNPGNWSEDLDADDGPDDEDEV